MSETRVTSTATSLRRSHSASRRLDSLFASLLQTEGEERRGTRAVVSTRRTESPRCALPPHCVASPVDGLLRVVGLESPAEGKIEIG